MSYCRFCEIEFNAYYTNGACPDCGNDDLDVLPYLCDPWTNHAQTVRWSTPLPDDWTLM